MNSVEWLWSEGIGGTIAWLWIHDGRCSVWRAPEEPT